MPQRAERLVLGADDCGICVSNHGSSGRFAKILSIPSSRFSIASNLPNICMSILRISPMSTVDEGIGIGHGRPEGWVGG